MQQIGIAVVEHHGRYLVGRRGDDVALAGMHEFPGGKCEPQESPAACAVRECREETGLQVEVVEELMRVTHSYSHGDVELHFWLCRPIAPDLVADDHNGYRWFTAIKLRELQFPEANAAVIDALQET